MPYSKKHYSNYKGVPKLLEVMPKKRKACGPCKKSKLKYSMCCGGKSRKKVK